MIPPDDDLCQAPPYMELSDDEDDDSNCCTPGGETRVPQRSASNPTPGDTSTGSPHSNGSVNTRLRSPSVDQATQHIGLASPAEGSKGQRECLKKYQLHVHLVYLNQCYIEVDEAK